jgi:response regulator of citrate/malate metabolism
MQFMRRTELSGAQCDRFPDNVIPFSNKRNSYVFYLCNEDSPFENWQQLSPQHQVCSLHSEEELRTALMVAKPKLILVRADLEWSDSLELIRQMESFSEAPRILLLKRAKGKKQELFIKQAYQAGISDILYLPLQQEEVVETLELLVRFSAKVQMS